MARGPRDLQEVELLEGEEPDASGAPVEDVARPRRPVRRWVILGAALVVVALVAVQQVVDARDRAQWERVAGVDGVVGPLGDTLDVNLLDEHERSELEASGQTTGPYVYVTTAPDGSQVLHATFSSVDTPVWSTSVTGPDPDLASALVDSEGFGGISRCVGAPGDERTAVCLVSDGYISYSDGGPAMSVPASSTKVVVVDPADGGIVTEWPAGPATALTTLPGLAVMAFPDHPARIVTIVGHDVRSGAERWRYVVPITPGQASENWGEHLYMFTAGDLVVVSTLEGMTLLDADGRFVRDDLRSQYGFGYQSGRSLIVSTTSSTGAVTTTVVAPDGDPAADRVYAGDLVNPAVDDGSAPGLVLTATTGALSLAEQINEEAAGTGPGLYGYDSETGEQRWFVRMSQLTAGMQPATAIVLGERVFVTSPDAAVVALDAHTGETLWTTEEHGSEFGIFTDGRLVFARGHRSVNEGGTQLIGRDLDTGEEVWRAPLPDGIDNLVVVDHTLLGQNFTTGESYELG